MTAPPLNIQKIRRIEKGKITKYLENFSCVAQVGLRFRCADALKRLYFYQKILSIRTDRLGTSCS